MTALSQHSLERAVRAAGIDVKPLWVDETGSTNEDARRLAEDGASEWTVVAARHQTAGRGRLERSWTDAPGRALTFSVILRPDLEPDRASILSLHAAVAVITAIGHPGLRAKWPNDVVIGERKVAGILGEARVTGKRLDHVLMGIGINLTMAPEDFPGEIRDRATSLTMEGVTADPAGILEGILRELRRPLGPGQIVEVYRRVCATLGRRIRARTTGGQEIEGVATEVDGGGALVVRTEGGPRTVSFGEVANLR